MSYANPQAAYSQNQPLEVFYKKQLFLKISNNSQENVRAGVSFLIKFRVQMFYYEFCEIFKTAFLQNISGRLLLYFQSITSLNRTLAIYQSEKNLYGERK